jgi:hypothetical protein
MTAEGMARFFERLGHRVVRTPALNWYDVYRGFYLGFPHHRLVEPRAADLRPVFRRFPAGLRYFSPADAPGRLSYALTIRDRGYDLDRLSANNRSKVRRGLARCTIERLPPAEVRKHGRGINDDTLRRIRLQERYPWEQYWDAAERSSDCVEVWGARVDGVLAAYLVAVRVDRCCEILIARSTSEMLKFYPNNALLFTVVRDMVQRPDVDVVFFGVQALDRADGTDAFKQSLGFEKTPIRQRVVFHPLLRPALQNALAVRVLGAMAARRPESEMWRKLHGLALFAAPAAATVPTAEPVAS